MSVKARAFDGPLTRAAVTASPSGSKSGPAPLSAMTLPLSVVSSRTLNTSSCATGSALSTAVTLVENSDVGP